MLGKIITFYYAIVSYLIRAIYGKNLVCKFQVVTADYCVVNILSVHNDWSSAMKALVAWTCPGHSFMIRQVWTTV